MKEIVIVFPKPCRGIKLIDSDEIKAHYDRIGKSVPFQFVGIPYVQIGKKQFAVVPLPDSPRKDEPCH